MTHLRQHHCDLKFCCYGFAMSSVEILESLRSLSKTERRELVARIWSEFAEDDLELTPLQAAELDRRMAVHEDAPDDVVTCEEIKQANRDRLS